MGAGSTSLLAYELKIMQVTRGRCFYQGHSKLHR